ncbi:MAG TPA: hypothetical protein PK156_27300 [Polyangium sp.]|nr:hypothetical protein [Polyangium sp.]
MPRPSFIYALPLALCIALGFGCNKNHDDVRANATSSTDAPTIAEFTSLDPSSWVNGSPVSLTETKGKHVVLIEAWHPT